MFRSIPHFVTAVLGLALLTPMDVMGQCKGGGGGKGGGGKSGGSKQPPQGGRGSSSSSITQQQTLRNPMLFQQNLPQLQQQQQQLQLQQMLQAQAQFRQGLQQPQLDLANLLVLATRQSDAVLERALESSPNANVREAAAQELMRRGLLISNPSFTSPFSSRIVAR